MKLTVNLGANSYPIYIKNNILSQAGYLYPRSLSWSQNYDHSDDIVYPIYGEA